MMSPKLLPNRAELDALAFRLMVTSSVRTQKSRIHTRTLTQKYRLGPNCIPAIQTNIDIHSYMYLQCLALVSALIYPDACITTTRLTTAAVSQSIKVILGAVIRCDRTPAMLRSCTPEYVTDWRESNGTNWLLIAPPLCLYTCVLWSGMNVIIGCVSYLCRRYDSG